MSDEDKLGKALRGKHSLLRKVYHHLFILPHLTAPVFFPRLNPWSIIIPLSPRLHHHPLAPYSCFIYFNWQTTILVTYNCIYPHLCSLEWLEKTFNQCLKFMISNLRRGDHQHLPHLFSLLLTRQPFHTFFLSSNLQHLVFHLYSQWLDWEKIKQSEWDITYSFHYVYLPHLT